LTFYSSYGKLVIYHKEVEMNKIVNIVTKEELHDHFDRVASVEFKEKFGRVFLRLMSLRYQALEVLEKKGVFFLDLYVKYCNLHKEERANLGVERERQFQLVLKFIADFKESIIRSIYFMNTQPINKVHTYLAVPVEKFEQMSDCEFLGFCICENLQVGPYKETCLLFDSTLLPERDLYSGRYKAISSWKGEIVKL